MPEQRYLDPKVAPCRCVRWHRPALDATHQHHVVPLGWGGNNRIHNLTALCPTSHDAVHRLLNAYKAHDGPPPWSVRRQFNAHVQEVAAMGWAHHLDQHYLR